MSKLPFVPPQLATAQLIVPDDQDYCHELKYDGFRIVAYLNNDGVRVYTRNANDWTYKFPNLVEKLQSLKLKNAILDGEIFVTNKKGHPDFQLLQNFAHKTKEQGDHIEYAIFDLLYLNNNNLTSLPLIERKEMLTKLLSNISNDNLHNVEYIIGHGKKLYDMVYEKGLEGIISKRLDAPYVSGRNKNWLKIKCFRSGNFTLIGYLQSQGRITSFLLAEKNRDALIYCGRISADFMNIDANQIQGIVKELITENSVVPGIPNLQHATWVKPQIQVTVRYTEKTQDGCLRQAMFTDIKI